MERVVFDNTISTVFPEDYSYDDAKPGDLVSPRFITWGAEKETPLTGHDRNGSEVISQTG